MWMTVNVAQETKSTGRFGPRYTGHCAMGITCMCLSLIMLELGNRHG